MAADTNLNLRRQMIYSIFVRNYSPEGTFEGVRRDLERIQKLGADIIWLMPIHPVGELHRKGSLGSPYAIRDYRAVNPEFGTMEDFIRLTEAIHERGMKCIIDVVYNHTSPDSVLSKEHPEWFYHKPDGNFGNRIGEWWDVIDLDYGTPDAPQEGLWEYQIETLCQWAQYVDGFRCDVAPMVPVEFWMRARAAVAKVRLDCIWLAESVEPEFVRQNRMNGIACASDSEAFRAFDISYEYDVYWYWNRCVTGEGSAEQYAAMINMQEGIYPANYVKLRFLENHDRLRAHFLIRDMRMLRNWTAFQFFQKGTALVYAGQEAACVHTPGLFDLDPVDWSGLDDPDRNLTGLMQRLSLIRKNEIPADSSYSLTALPHDVFLGILTENKRHPLQEQGRRVVGIFSCKGYRGGLSVGTFGIPDGTYTDLISDKAVEVNMGQTFTDGEPVIIML